MSKKPWIDIRLQPEEMTFLRDAIDTSIEEQKGKDWRNNTAGNASRSTLIDKDNWFYETVLKKLIEKMFYDDWDNYRKYHIVKEHPLPKFEMNRFWVNYQKQHEFNPLHFHSPCLYSFVIFMKIPTHWREQHKMNNDDFRAPVASDFVFVWGGEENGILIGEYKDINRKNLQLSSEDEGRMLFFPAWLKHMVYPFYECEEERITISGNIDFVNSNKLEALPVPVNAYEEKEEALKLMENSVRVTREELKRMKK